jgi:3-dehydroquinate synthase
MIGDLEARRVEAVIAGHGLPTRLRSPLPVSALMEAMARDKKARAGALRFVLLSSLGEATVRGDVPAAEVEAVWRDVGGA